MATGDASDIQGRLKGLIPGSWFPAGASPVFDAVMAGAAAPAAWAYSLYLYVLQQSRIRTATGVWLDRIAYDYFGARFLRRPAEADALFRARIVPEILRERGTRKGVLQALYDLTGRVASMVEFTNPKDCGSYRGPYIGYGLAGCYGTLLAGPQAFVLALRPSTSGIPEIPGYGITSTPVGHVLAGYGKTGKYCGLSEITAAVTDAMIFKTVADIQAAGVILWTRIESIPPLDPSAPRMDFSDPNNSFLI